VTFSKRVDRVGKKFLAAGQVKKCLVGEACVFMMFASLKEDVKKGVGDLSECESFQKFFQMTLPTYVRREKWSLQLIWYQERVLFRRYLNGYPHQNWVR